MQTIIERFGFDPALDADNGNRFLCGNGYMGVRGTICEAGAAQMAAVNLAGIHHQKGDGWREPLNAPNPLYFRVEGAALPENADQVVSHRLALDISCGLFSRTTTFCMEGGSLTLTQERFCAMENVHLLAQRITLTADADMALSVEHGVDERVWDIHGPHFEGFTCHEKGGVIALNGCTDKEQQVATCCRSTLSGDIRLHGGVSRSKIHLQANVPLVIDTVSAVCTSQDCDQPADMAMQLAASAADYDTLLSAQQQFWAGLWADAAVEIEGDERAEFAVNYSLYHLMSIAPRHHGILSVPARGLSGQTYKGAIFWDTEMFMLDFYLSCMPEVARTCLQYRIETLPGALAKAASYGLKGAFYAWESQDGGYDACTDYSVTDVFTGRPMRTFFRDKQVHISSAVVYGLRKYAQRTGDDSLMRDGGAQVILECARFYFSLLSRKLDSDVYDLKDVVGPDEYHERVNNNAYTNEMARMTLRCAAELCPKYLPDVSAEEMAAFIDAAEHLKCQQPDAQTGLIEQFDGYFALEDVSVDTVRSRLLDPREYWGGAYGVAAHTQVLKQADVIAMLYMLGGYPEEIIRANYDYYEPRTEHGSSLSACMYALCACKTGRPDAAYPLFLKSAEADIQGGGKQWAGLVYIGGTHPAAQGGAYMVLLNGFLGLTFEDGKPVLHPRLPEGWKHVRLRMKHQGVQYVLEV